jgi:L-fuconate dehydratase
MKKRIIQHVEVLDIRVPTSDTLLGSDPFHTKPDYSAVYTIIHCSSGNKGVSIVFTCGAGNDWIAYGIKQLISFIKDYAIDDFISNPGHKYKEILNHHQLRWLADGVFRMALGGIMNALWDLWAKEENVPLWKLLVGLPDNILIDCIDWRYLNDALTKKEAAKLLQKNHSMKRSREKELNKCGVAAYLTVGWLGLEDNEIMDKIKELYEKGFRAFKIKVGNDLARDRKRLAAIRKKFGKDIQLMVDANQIWGVKEAIDYMKEIADFGLLWIEEPTARDDVLAHQIIARELNAIGIGIAAGEQIPSPTLFKQMLTSGALQFCQIDAARMGGVNDVLAVILLAEKYSIPVCPHGGGIGLCNMIIHFAVWDQICVIDKVKDNRFVEYIDFLQNGVFMNPIEVVDGQYTLPKANGWGLEMKEDFISNYIYPTGKIWRKRKKFFLPPEEKII